MLFKYVKTLFLASVLGGLCACAQVNTTARGPAVSPAPASSSATAPSSPLSSQQAQKDVPAPAEPVRIPTPAVTAVPLPVQKIGPTRIALILPLRSDALGPAANVVRAGFMAGFEREKDSGLSVTVVETGDGAQDVLASYNTAAASHDIVVGPLTRSGVTAIVQNGTVIRPTIALGQPDTPGDAEHELPQKMLAIGLAMEDEARQVANWLRTDRAGGKALIVSTGTAWQRRAARAFAASWQRFGARAMTMELETTSGFFSPAGLLQLRKRIELEKPDFLFVALDATQTRQLREAIGTDTAMYGTSQLNPYARADWLTAEPLPEMNGVHLVDIPWQLQPDHPAVMVYPRLIVAPDQRRSPDLERLYALGIDAYRIAREIAFNRTRFDLDGVTGKLKVDMGRGIMRFERLQVPAVYQDGIVVPLAMP